MKNIIRLFILSLLIFANTSLGNVGAYYDEDFSTDYIMENVDAFIQSPDREDLDTLSEDDNIQHCESIYIQAYMRRDFTESELSICGNYFEMKFEQEISYKNYMYNNRELFY
ncbi:hypothetical protein A9Q91_03545 [Candidatus Gracilibacteria bacterium 28_42_T64]|nr:hypothetical protein A9Q91_03545 [Candidatus Gracilibacteria bacterium 28_42_T64]